MTEEIWIVKYEFESLVGKDQMIWLDRIRLGKILLTKIFMLY
jgi:hypothetical protein